MSTYFPLNYCIHPIKQSWMWKNVLRTEQIVIEKYNAQKKTNEEETKEEEVRLHPVFCLCLATPPHQRHRRCSPWSRNRGSLAQHGESSPEQLSTAISAHASSITCRRGICSSHRCYCEAAQVWLYFLPSLPHYQTKLADSHQRIYLPFVHTPNSPEWKKIIQGK